MANECAETARGHCSAPRAIPRRIARRREARRYMQYAKRRRAIPRRLARRRETRRPTKIERFRPFILAGENSLDYKTARDANEAIIGPHIFQLVSQSTFINQRFFSDYLRLTERLNFKLSCGDSSVIQQCNYTVKYIFRNYLAVHGLPSLESDA